MSDELTPDEVKARIDAVKGQLQPLSQQLEAALMELGGLEGLLAQVETVRKPGHLLRAVEDNLRALVEQLNATMRITLPPLAHTETNPAAEAEEDEDETAEQEGDTVGEESTVVEETKTKDVSVQPQGARFITLIGETHRIVDIPTTFAEAAAALYEQQGGLDAPIRIPIGGQRRFAHVPLRFVLARGGGFHFWKNVQAARKTLGELYKTYGKSQIRKSHPVSPGARKMHNRTRNRGLDRVDEILAKWEASLEVDAARLRIEVMSELVVRFLIANFENFATLPTTRDEALTQAYEEWQSIPLIIVRRTGGQEGEEIITTFLRPLEEDLAGNTSHYVDSLGWVITQLEMLRRGGNPLVNLYVRNQLQLALEKMGAADDDRWARIIDVLWRQYKILESEVARKVTKFAS